LFDNTAPTIDPSTINHDDLANINALEHIDWTNTNETLATTGLVISSNISGNNTGDQDLFNRVSILGALPTTDLVATSPTDTITFVAGQNIQLSSDNTTNQITISSTGGGGALPTPIAIDKVTYDPDGVQTSFALPASVDNEGSVLVFFDGVYQGQDSYNFVGAAPFSTITFVDPLNVPTAPFASIDKLTIFTYNEDDLELVRESFTDVVDYTSGTTTNLTLPVTPNSEDDVVIFFDGGFVNRSSYSVAGPIITFNDPILLNTDKVDVIIFVDTGPGGVDVDLDRRVYEAGIDFVPGLTSLLALPANIEAEEDLLVFFDGSYIGNESYDGLNSLISFNDPIPVFTNRIDIITLNGGAAAAIDPNSFGIIQVAGQADVNAIVPTDALKSLLMMFLEKLLLTL
jgi:hypothetical protein